MSHKLLLWNMYFQTAARLWLPSDEGYMSDVVINKGISQTVADIDIEKQMIVVLDRFYPGHLWYVVADSHGGVATIRNFRLSGEWGFVLKLVGTYSQSEFDKRLVMAAGELLERYRLSRGGFKQGQYDALPMVGNALEISL